MKRIKKFNELFEFKSSTYTWDWVKKHNSGWTGFFNSTSDRYIVRFSRQKFSNIWKTEFESDALGVSGERFQAPKEAMQVLMTVGYMILEFFFFNKDAEVEFLGSADDNGNPNAPSRRDRVYQAMLKDLPSKYHYNIGKDKMTVRIANKDSSLDPEPFDEK